MRDSIEAAKSEINEKDSSAKSMISSINLYYLKKIYFSNVIKRINKFFNINFYI